MKLNLKLAILSISILILSSSFILSRKKSVERLRVVTGTVFYSNGLPPNHPNLEKWRLPGAHVIAFENDSMLVAYATTTDIEGNYSLNVPTNATKLLYIFIGTNSQEVPLRVDSVYNVDLIGVEE
jgi:hypothetical protein